VEGEATPVDEVARQMGRQAVEAVAVVNGSNRNVTMCSDVTSSQGRPDEHSSIRDGPDPFAVQTRMNDKSDSSSVESGGRRSSEELSGRGTSELGRCRASEKRRSMEDLRVEISAALRAQQATLLDAIAQSEARQAETLANAWAVFVNSIATMKSPAEVSSPVENRLAHRQRVGGQVSLGDNRVINDRRCSEKEVPTDHCSKGNGRSVNSYAVVNSTSERVVDVVSPTRSVESEGQRRNPSPRGEENGRRLSGSALVDAASVPLVYPPTELGRQGISYELEGSGTIPGGMPSGVPPSVYLTPVDAPNQQYMSRSMTMIPEGMPTGVPASVYRTPMDALNHQQVNRDIMSSVYGNAMQCSPELFPPVGSVYYAAPNMAAPVNTRMFREPAMSFSHSEQTVSEQVSEADSGIEKSESGRFRGNSRSQREELGDRQSSMSRSALRSAETGSRKSVRCASIGNDGQVFLFVSSDSDVPDESENRPVSTDEPSAKRESADRAETTRKLNRKHVASSEKVSKGRSASKERHRRSRPSSETRSPSCHGEQRDGRNRLVNLNESFPSAKNERRSQSSKK